MHVQLSGSVFLQERQPPAVHDAFFSELQMLQELEALENNEFPPCPVNFHEVPCQS